MPNLWRPFPHFLKTLAILSTIGILLVVMAGALVTKTGSAEGCGANWPLCHDQLIPDNPTIETVIEYSHRLVTGVVGILVLWFSVWMAIKYRKIREVVWVAMASIFFLLLQSALGAMAVVYGQSSAIKALHFGFSLLSFASLLILSIYVYQLEKRSDLPAPILHSNLRLWVSSLFVYTYIVVYIGAYVRHTGSSLACLGWPLCNGEIVPPLVGQVGIQFTHRIAALILFIGITLLAFHAIRIYKSDRIIYLSTIMMFFLALVQVISGGILVITKLQIIPSLLHALFVSILFGILCYLLLYVFRKNPNQ
jgi:cytochrome c oxidase assembly protein subunit 15